MPQRRLKLTWAFALCALPLGAQNYGPIGTQLHDWPEESRLEHSNPLLEGQAPARTVSAELLSYPISDKARHMLQKAVEISAKGDHPGAVLQLQKTLAKFPNTGAYVYSLIGVEYLKTRQIPDAVDALERSVALLPHDASNHVNFGIGLVLNGQKERAAAELKRALELDPHYAMATQLLSALAVPEGREK
jgi:Flp pilus assembly protein TadD